MAFSFSDFAPASAPHQYGEQPVVAALDIGSNSFHLVIARYVDGDFQFLERQKQQVRLADGLDSHGCLSGAAIKRAMACLDQMAEQVSAYQPAQVRAVATHTLRTASNAEQFLQLAVAHFPVPIEVISGIQEAKLIYQGVAHLSNIRRPALVIDIGGGSTEFIIGADFQERQLRSCPVGCINLTKRFFSNGKIDPSRMIQLVETTQQLIAPFRDKYINMGWQHCLGSSGSIKVIDKMLKAQGYRKRIITLEHLLATGEQLMSFTSLDQIQMPGLDAERATILPAALGILIAAFKSLGIEQMTYSRGALREGLLYSVAQQHFAQFQQCPPPQQPLTGVVDG